jgi:hypothetical protein
LDKTEKFNAGAPVSLKKGAVMTESASSAFSLRGDRNNKAITVVSDNVKYYKLNDGKFYRASDITALDPTAKMSAQAPVKLKEGAKGVYFTRNVVAAGGMDEIKK